MEFVDPDDGPAFRRPPSVDDRLWRHPSELGGAEVATPKLVPFRTVWLVAVVAAVGASALTSGLVIGLDVRSDDPVAGEQAAITRLGGAPAGDTADEPVVGIAERARPTIAQIRASGPGSTVSGSAVFFRNDGHLLTNAHVVEDASSLHVVLSSGRELPARLVGSDPVTDSAVVKVDGAFAVADFGTAADLKVGQSAVAIGSPLALAGGPSVTVGVVSALHRTVRTRNGKSMFDMIQTDAPIAQGSSGGALLDGNGRVIGITTAAAVSDAGPEGVGFAIPIDVARSVADELMATGRATHAWMGVEGTDLDGALAHDLNLEGAAIVRKVLNDGPAAAAGLAVGDVVTSINGRQIGSMGSLVTALRSHRPGEQVTVEVMRDRQRTMRSLTLTERPPEP
ncbi:MAG: S1C family serine protease [Actinobacteria bacterium]|nr:S1C family serine protease [Actinomycetota bacterium]